jgi:hypothetical protein
MSVHAIEYLHRDDIAKYWPMGGETPSSPSDLKSV